MQKKAASSQGCGGQEQPACLSPGGDQARWRRQRGLLPPPLSPSLTAYLSVENSALSLLDGNMGTAREPGSPGAPCSLQLAYFHLFPSSMTQNPWAGSQASKLEKRQDHSAHCITVSRGLGISGKQMRVLPRAQGPRSSFQGLRRTGVQFLAGKRQGHPAARCSEAHPPHLDPNCTWLGVFHVHPLPAQPASESQDKAA